MPMLIKKLRELEKNFDSLENGKVVNYFSESQNEISGVKFFYGEKYHILGPTFISDENKYILTFVYDKKKVIVENKNA